MYIQDGESKNLKKKKVLEKTGMFTQEKANMRHESCLQTSEEQPHKEKY